MSTAIAPTPESSSSSTMTTTTSTTAEPTIAAKPAASRSVFFTLAARYLLLYNVTMTGGWLLVLLRLVQAVVRGQAVYDAVQLPLKVFQTGAVLEIVHAATRLIRSSPMTTAFQVGSRLMLVWGVVEPVVAVRAVPQFTTMVLAWSLTEIPRYFYFSVAALTSQVPFWVTVTRYSTFLPLYPLGAGSEWLTLYSALPYIEKVRPFSMTMPNRFNFAFDYYLYCVGSLALYIPGLPYMYSHMLHQRRKYVTQQVDSGKVKNQ